VLFCPAPADLTAISNDAAHFAQAAAVIAGGTFAWWKYLRGRTFRARADLAVSAVLWSSDTNSADTALALTVSLRNTGLSRIRLVVGAKAVLVDWVTRERWALSQNELYWGPSTGMRQTDIFGGHDWIEPGEMITDDVVIPVPSALDDGPLAYRVRAHVVRSQSPILRQLKRPREVWAAYVVVPGTLYPKAPEAIVHEATEVDDEDVG
jgi:hypothetical protein